jgi:two-component system, sensor histidine kinase and response regulator
MGILGKIQKSNSLMSSYSILVVDDEPDNFDTIEALLPSETYQLHYANCGQDALSALDKFDPDVILLDVMMPDLDGIEVCKRIRLMSKWYTVPIIMVTALSSKEDLARCLAAGADDFINKPVSGLELTARVNSMLRIKRQHDRIKSFSKLQRNNIHTLTNDLNEIRLDLAVGFPNEFNSPLSILSDNIDHLKQHIKYLSLPETLELLDSSEQSVTSLYTLTQKFWLYLRLIVDTPKPSNLDRATTKPVIERILATRFAKSLRLKDLACDIQDTTMAVNSDLAEWVFNETLDYMFNNYQSNTYLKISGQVIDNSFHLSLSNCQGNIADNHTDMSTFIQFSSSEDEGQDLDIGLKIIKKIVEIYDGIFLISGLDKNDVSIYLTLPLVSAATPMIGSPHELIESGQN